MTKLKTSSSNKAIVAMLVVAALAAAFWMLLLSPKRETASELGAEVVALKASLAQHEAEAAEAEAAREEFPAGYRRLVVLGKAVPGDDDIASLLVQLDRIAAKAGGTFRDLDLSEAGDSEEASPPAVAAGGTPVSATEVSASLLPLGASIGPAGLAVMPYDVAFDGNFFEVADFIAGIDSLVKTGSSEVRVDGRLVTIDGFSLSADANKGFPALQGTFALTTYLTPPGEGITAGATPSTPGTVTAAPASTTVGGTP